MRHMGCVPLALRLMVALSERPRLPLLRRPNRLSRCAAAVRVSGLLPAGLPFSADPCTAKAVRLPSFQHHTDLKHKTIGLLWQMKACGKPLMLRALYVCVARALGICSPALPLLGCDTRGGVQKGLRWGSDLLYIIVAVLCVLLVACCRAVAQPLSVLCGRRRIRV